MKKLILLAILSITLFGSCKKEKGPQPTAPVTATANDTVYAFEIVADSAINFSVVDVHLSNDTTTYPFRSFNKGWVFSSSNSVNNYYSQIMVIL